MKIVTTKIDKTSFILKSNLLVLFLIVLFSCSTEVVRRNEQGKPISRERLNFSPVRKKICLLTLFNEGLYGGEDLGITATEELRVELSRSGAFVIDGLCSKIFGTSKEIFAGGGLKLAVMSKRAKQTGINFVVFGRIIKAKARDKTDEIGFVRKTISYVEAVIELRIYDVISNKEVFTRNYESYIDDSSYNFYLSDPKEHRRYRQELLRYGIKVAVRKSVPEMITLASRLDWTGRVAKIIGTRIYVNTGRQSGLQVGDILKVMTEGTQVYDPETGALIGTTSGEVKGTLEIIDYFGPDGSIASLHSGGSISEGDFVQLY